MQTRFALGWSALQIAGTGLLTFSC